MDDFAAIAALERAIFPTFWSENALREMSLNEKNFFLLERAENGVLAGYLIGWIVGDEAELARIGVLPEYRGQGIAGRLLDAGLRHWRERGAQQVFLEVRESNAAALGLYASRGFEIVGKRADYYENGEAALVMRFRWNPNFLN